MEEEELPLKISLTQIINGFKNTTISELLDVLKKCRNRLYICGHCGGETDDYGQCLEKTWGLN